MIVVDTNVILPIHLTTPGTVESQEVLVRDPVWFAPPLWRSEHRNALAMYVHTGRLGVAEAEEAQALAEALLAGGEREVECGAVLRLSAASRCTAYDCEFLALAGQLGAPLVTRDAALRATFPNLAVSPAEFLAL